MMLPPRPSWPADEITTEFDLVGSKFGAGVFPGTRSASSRKLRPFSGSTSIRADRMTASTTERLVSTAITPMPPSTFTLTRTLVERQFDNNGRRLPDFERDALLFDVPEPRRRNVDVHHPRCQIRGNERAVRAGHDSPRLRGICRRDRDDSRRHRRALWIVNTAAQRGRCGLGVAARGERKCEQCGENEPWQ